MSKDKNNKKFAVASVKAFIEREGKILILRESTAYKAGSNHGKYVMPGGKVDEGEHFLDSLKREVKEECGLRVKIGEPFHVDEWRVSIKNKPSHIVGIFFRCSSAEDNVNLNNEFDHYEWIKPEEYDKYELNIMAKRAFESYLKL